MVTDFDEGKSEKKDQAKRENQPLQAQDIIDAIKEIWRKGNASYLDVEKGGQSFLHISLTVGTIGLTIAPVVAVIGLGAALITDYVVKITLVDGTVINVNDFVVTRPKQTGSGEGPDD